MVLKKILYLYREHYVTFDGYKGNLLIKKQRELMLRWSITFLIIAIIAAILGFGGIAGAAAGIAEILFYVFIVLFVLSLIFGRRASV